jgi:CRP/FNR family transcriptional regulator, cyclic AMP receptor protein
MARRDATLELLKRVPLFAHCSRAELRRIALAADEIDLREGKVFTREGEPGREFFVLIEGSADVVRKGKKVNVLNPGDFFGEIALVSDRPRSATVTAATPTRVLVVTARDFRRVMLEVPSIQLKVLQALVERLPPEAF